MEILFVSHKYPPSVGGMEKQSFELINGMKKYAKVHTIVYDGRGSRLKFFLTLNKEIIKVCEEHPGISIIHFNDGLMVSFSLFHKGYEHLKRVVTLHGLDVVFPNIIFRKNIIPRLNKFHLIVTVSKATADACVKLGISPDKIVVINNGVDPDIAVNKPRTTTFEDVARKYNLTVEGKRILVTMGRPVKRKGFSWFIENVLPKLQGEYILLMIGPCNRKTSVGERSFRMIPVALRRKLELILGYPTDEQVIRRLLTTPAVKDKVKHLGRLPFDEMVAVLKHADAFIVPNIAIEGDMEGFGLVCLEACLCGAIVYASNIDGIPDAIHHEKNGILVQAGHANAWSFEINKLLLGDGEYTLRKEDFQSYTLNTFSWDKMVYSYWHHFKDL